jgi:uncharacterized protein
MSGNFSDLTPDQRRALGSRGGKNAHASGNAHKWTPEEARKAGRKSGRVRKRGPRREPDDNE